MKFTFVCVLLIGLVLLVVGQDRKREEKGVAQSTDARSSNDQVEVKTDRFSNMTTVVLKPQVILDKPDHQLTMEIKTKLGEKTFSDWERERVMAIVSFESQSQSKGSVDFGDRELHYMVDGKPLNPSKTDFSVNSYADRYGKLKPGFKISETIRSFFDRRALEQFSKAGHIEMRLGAIELTLSQPIVTNLREYAKQVLEQHKATMERKQ